jgi:cell division protein FtsQ
MAVVSAGTDKRFRRAHVKPARQRAIASKQAWVAAKVLVLLLVVAFGAWRAVSLVAHARALQIGHLVVHGQERLASGEVLALVDGLRGQNILLVRLDTWRARLLTSPWVEDATLRRVLPATVDVLVKERKPMGIGRIGSALYLIDAHGVIIDEYGPAYADIDLPMIDGTAAAPGDGGALVDPARAAFAARVMASLSSRPDVAKRVSQIDVDDLHNAVVMLDGDTALLRLGDTGFVERLQQYLDLAPALRARMAGIDYVDLRFDERLYVRPAKAASTVAQVGRK